jgi:chromosome partitioning protein
MAQDFDERRPRRRIFGRRRPDEPVPPHEAAPETREPVPVDPSSSSDPAAAEATTFDEPTAPAADAEEEVATSASNLPPQPEAPEASAREPGSEVAERGDLEARQVSSEVEAPADVFGPDASVATARAAEATLIGAAAIEPEAFQQTESAPMEAPDEVTTAPPGADDLGGLPLAVNGTTPLELPRIVAIANQKGGVGKTTTAVNLGAALAELGLRVLVVDLDPQGNASTGLGISPRDVSNSIYDVIMNDTPAVDAVEPTSLKNLFVIPATIDLAGSEIELVPAFSRELRLRRALEAVRSEYDVVLIDCPPSLGLLTVNGLAAADDVIVPIQCEYYALEGLGQLLRNVALVRSNLNPTLDVRGIVLTMFDGRTRLAEQVEAEVREHFGSKVYRTVIPRTVRLSEAPSFGQPIIVFDSTSRGASAYRELAKEVSGGDETRRSG